MYLTHRLQRGLAYLAVVTCSFEIFLIINLGFNFKFCQIVIILAALLFSIEVWAGRAKVATPPQLWVICIAILLAVLFSANSNLIERSLGYCLWFIFDVLGVVLFFNVFKYPNQFIRLIKVSLFAVCINSCFGLAQFMLGVIGLPAPLVTQWWIEGRLPRINGFNYEPSFYATYLMMGWILSMYLLEKRPPRIGRRLILLSVASSSLALLLCSSRMGWFAMLLWFGRPLAKAMFRLVRRGRLPRQQFRLFRGYVMTFGLIIGSIFVFFSVSQLEILLSGLGVVSQGGSYSADERSETTFLTGRVALDHLIFGVGLGGIPAEIAKFSGATASTLEDAKLYEGKNITFELIGSLGLVGAIAVYGFIFLSLRQALKASAKLGDCGEDVDVALSVCLRGLCWAIVVEFMLLQFNQNFLRTYTWMYIGILFAGLRTSSVALRANSVTMPEPVTSSPC